MYLLKNYPLSKTFKVYFWAALNTARDLEKNLKNRVFRGVGNVFKEAMGPPHVRGHKVCKIARKKYKMVFSQKLPSHGTFMTLPPSRLTLVPYSCNFNIQVNIPIVTIF